MNFDARLSFLLFWWRTDDGVDCLAEAVSFIDAALARVQSAPPGSNNVLVHCELGQVSLYLWKQKSQIKIGLECLFIVSKIYTKNLKRRSPTAGITTYTHTLTSTDCAYSFMYSVLAWLTKPAFGVDRCIRLIGDQLSKNLKNSDYYYCGNWNVNAFLI